MIYSDRFIQTDGFEVLVEVTNVNSTSLVFMFKDKPVGFHLPDIEAHYHSNRVQLITKSQIIITSGPLYNQLEPWAVDIFKDINKEK